MRYKYWTLSMAAVLAVTGMLGGCGGSKPDRVAHEVVGSPAPTGARVANLAPAQALSFEVIAAGSLPAPLTGWSTLTALPNTPLAARIGDWLYVLVTGDKETAGAAELTVQAVELREQPYPEITVSALVGLAPPGQPSRGFARAYLRIPYEARRPVPGVSIRTEVGTAGGISGADPAGSAPGSAGGSAPGSAGGSAPGSAGGSAGGSQPGSTGTATPGPTVSTSPTTLTFTTIRESVLPSTIAFWRQRPATEPMAVATYADGALFLMIAAGERPSGGYSVEIRSVAIVDGSLHVTARVLTPRPDAMVTQAITYPRGYARIDLQGSGDLPVVVIWQ